MLAISHVLTSCSQADPQSASALLDVARLRSRQVVEIRFHGFEHGQDAASETCIFLDAQRCTDHRSRAVRPGMMATVGDGIMPLAYRPVGAAPYTFW